MERSPGVTPEGQKQIGIPRLGKGKSLPQHNPQIAICRTDAAWDAARLRAGLGWNIRNGSDLERIQGATIQNFVSSPLIAEAIALREGLYTVANQGFSHLWMCSDNLTLIRAINNNVERKELVGIINDIHNLSSGFVSIAFFHIAREDNEESDALAKVILFNSIV